MIIIDDADSKRVQVHITLAQDNDRASQNRSNGHLGSVHPQSPPNSTQLGVAQLRLSPSSYRTTDTFTTAQPLPPWTTRSSPPSYPNIPTACWQHPAPSSSATATATATSFVPRSPAKRFWKAFALAFFLYLALLSLARSIFYMARTNSGIWDDDAVGVPKSEDGRILESISSHDWTAYQHRPPWAPNFPESAETSFILPVTSNTLYLISRGSYQNGKVEVRQSSEDSNDVRVDVRVAYHDARALARGTVCRLRKSGNKHGVGIYTPIPAWTHTRDRLYFEVVFIFPAAPSDRTPLRIHEFMTHTSNFEHDIGDLWQSLFFENVQFDASNAAIHANSITMTKGSLVSSNGAITGHFNTSDALILSTSNARIQVTASLFNAERGPTKLDMRTSNGQITSSVSLATESGTGGNFVVTSRSSNGAIDLRYDDAPSGSRLISDARTSNSPALVVMHPTFEGTYDLSTSNAHPLVRDRRPEDPTGWGRRRVVRQNTSRGRVEGRVWWVGDGRRGGEGTSTVHTSNARVMLDL